MEYTVNIKDIDNRVDYTIASVDTVVEALAVFEHVLNEILDADEVTVDDVEVLNFYLIIKCRSDDGKLKLDIASLFFSKSMPWWGMVEI